MALRTLFRPVDIASLVAFRIAFGLLMLVAVGRHFAYDWIGQFFLTPRLFFPYPGLEWIVPLPGAGMYALYAVLGGLALCVACGLWYRPSVALLGLGFTYVHLIDRTNYLNHYHLLSLLCLLLLVVPAHRAASLDAVRRPARRAASVPAWAVWLLRFQLAVVYAFGAVAKLNPDWLLRAQPLRIWLGASVDLPLLGVWLEQPWVAYVFSYAGLLFDASIVAFLLWRRSRPLAYAVVLVFHVLTAVLFPIGMFPWIMIALTPIFFAPDWPRRLWHQARSIGRPYRDVTRPASESPSRVGLAPGQYATVLGLGLYAALQIALPLRHLAVPGQLYWDEHDFRFAWQIMVMEKYGQAAFDVRDPASGESWHIAPRDYLTSLQTRMMATQPDMIRSFAGMLGDEFRRRGHAAVEVRADVRVTLNGRPHQLLIDPAVDLARADLPAGWILPLADTPADRLAAAR